MTIDSEDRPIQIVCSLLSFYGQCYIQNKKRVKPSNRIDLFYRDHLYLSGSQSQPLSSWAEMDEIILISTVFMPSVVVLLFLSLLSLAIMFTCHCILLFVGRQHITRSSVLLLLLLSLITRCCPLWKTTIDLFIYHLFTIDLFTYHLLLHVVVVNTQNIDLELSVVLLFCLRWAISIVYPYLKSLSCCCLW